MLPFPVGEDLGVLETHGPHVGMAGEGNALYPLVLEAVEPAFGRRVVPGFALSPDGSRNGASPVFPAVALAAHRAGHAVVPELVLQGVARVRAAPVNLAPDIGQNGAIAWTVDILYTSSDPQSGEKYQATE